MNGKCCLDPRQKMYKKTCYADFMAEKTKRKLKFIVHKMDNFEFTYEMQIYDAINHLVDMCNNEIVDEWYHLSKREKIDMANKLLMFYVQRNKKLSQKHQYEYQIPDSKKNKYFSEFLVGLVDSCLGAWRNEPYVRCLRCGEVIENNSRKNRKYCTSCSGYIRKEYVELKCPDCGRLFYVDTPNNRQYRCIDCQNEANKVSQRERARRYRERKRNAIS